MILWGFLKRCKPLVRHNNTTHLPPVMSNKGKPWLPEHDAFLRENVNLPNEQLAGLLERSALAIECRRARLAASLSKAEGAPAIEECIERLRADPERTNRCLEQIKNTSTSRPPNKRTRLASTADNNTISKLSKKRTWQAATADNNDAISAVAESILTSGGSMLQAWAKKEFVSVMIQHYNGFEAYAAFVRSTEFQS